MEGREIVLPSGEYGEVEIWGSRGGFPEVWNGLVDVEMDS